VIDVADGADERVSDVELEVESVEETDEEDMEEKEAVMLP